MTQPCKFRKIPVGSFVAVPHGRCEHATERTRGRQVQRASSNRQSCSTRFSLIACAPPYSCTSPLRSLHVAQYAVAKVTYGTVFGSHTRNCRERISRFKITELTRQQMRLLHSQTCLIFAGFHCRPHVDEGKRIIGWASHRFYMLLIKKVPTLNFNEMLNLHDFYRIKTK